jgi:hypothetical protein
MASDSKYNSVIEYLGAPLPSWVTEQSDQVRVAAYDGYDAMYRNVPGTFLIRSGQDVPIYVPGAYRIVEATNRYLGRDWTYTIESVNQDAQSANSQTADLMLAFHNLFVREEFKSKLFSLKRHMLQRGDALLHITANLGAPAGQRLVIDEPHPRNYFRISAPGAEEVTVGCYLTDLVLADDGKTNIARRMEYRYDPAGSGKIWAQLTFWEPGGWDDRFVDSPSLKPVATPLAYSQNPAMATLLTGYFLPDSVRTIPVYLFRNRREGGEPFGTSQIAGIETLIGAVNNTVSDEDVTLALQGLGVYMTDSARPVGDDGVTEAEWVISPGTVIEVKVGTKFERIAGVGSTAPFQEHLSYLDKSIETSAGLSATAIGNVDASVAASGVALRLDMAPILAQNEEKEVELLGRLDQIFFDLLTMWFPVDGVSVPPGIIVTNQFGDPLPVDREAVIAEMVALATAGIVSKAFAASYLSKRLGYQFPEGMVEEAMAEAALADPAGARIGQEAAGEVPGGTPEPLPTA